MYYTYIRIYDTTIRTINDNKHKSSSAATTNIKSNTKQASPQASKRTSCRPRRRRRRSRPQGPTTPRGCPRARSPRRAPWARCTWSGRRPAAGGHSLRPFPSLLKWYAGYSYAMIQWWERGETTIIYYTAAAAVQFSSCKNQTHSTRHTHTHARAGPADAKSWLSYEKRFLQFTPTESDVFSWESRIGRSMLKRNTHI